LGERADQETQRVSERRQEEGGVFIVKVSSGEKLKNEK
jgi:hypothetical protein